MTTDEIRRLAFSLPEATEEPHHHLVSFRIRGKIFATMPPDGRYLHVFVDEILREMMIGVNPEAFEKLWWGKKVVGLRADLSLATPRDIAELLRSAWQRKAPKSLLTR